MNRKIILTAALLGIISIVFGALKLDGAIISHKTNSKETINTIDMVKRGISILILLSFGAIVKLED